MVNHIYSFSLEELQNTLLEHSYKPFHAKQIFKWLYQKNIVSFDKMTDLSEELRDYLQNNFVINTMQLEKRSTSADAETFKFLFKLQDGYYIETVLILGRDEEDIVRRTVCLSTQVGCAMGCLFCASCKNGFIRNLTAGEILEQGIYVNIFLQNHYANCENINISHVVFMGMGEPFLNYESLIKSLKILTLPLGFNISQRRITVSTVGVLDNIENFIKEDIKVNLTFSLHAPEQGLREKIIPSARRYPLGDILKKLDLYFDKTGREITYEYILLEGINDQKEHARVLVDLLKYRRGCVNIIPYNRIQNSTYNKPTRYVIESFINYLSDYGLRVTRRYTKGDDIAAACGQLAACENIIRP
jgi:23S rRNA (adenine2503-C2)-methyltransferase